MESVEQTKFPGLQLFVTSPASGLSSVGVKMLLLRY